MRAMTNSGRVTVDREQVAQRLCRLRGSPTFRGSQQIQRVQLQRESQAQRESQPFKGSLPSGSDGREASSKIVRKVSWVEELGRGSEAGGF
jgi:hypothetical protein